MDKYDAYLWHVIIFCTWGRMKMKLYIAPPAQKKKPNVFYFVIVLAEIYTVPGLKEHAVQPQQLFGQKRPTRYVAPQSPYKPPASVGFCPGVHPTRVNLSLRSGPVLWCRLWHVDVHQEIQPLPKREGCVLQTSGFRLHKSQTRVRRDVGQWFLSFGHCGRRKARWINCYWDDSILEKPMIDIASLSLRSYF